MASYMPSQSISIIDVTNYMSLCTLVRLLGRGAGGGVGVAVTLAGLEAETRVGHPQRARGKHIHDARERGDKEVLHDRDLRR